MLEIAWIYGISLENIFVIELHKQTGLKTLITKTLKVIFMQISL